MATRKKYVTIYGTGVQRGNSIIYSIDGGTNWNNANISNDVLEWEVYFDGEKFVAYCDGYRHVFSYSYNGKDWILGVKESKS